MAQASSLVGKVSDFIRSGSQSGLSRSNSKGTTPSPRGQPLPAPVTLTLKVLEAKNLPSKDINGFSDPYCLVTVTGTNTASRQRTKTIEKSLSPVWSAKYEFDIVVDNASIEIEVWDEDWMKPDDYIGNLTVPLTSDFRNQAVDRWFPLQDRHNGNKPAGEIHLYISYQPKKKNLTVDDFVPLALLGKGAFGKVIQVRRKSNNKIYAMKVIEKAQIVKQQEVEHTLAERAILRNLKHPFMIGLRYSFQTDTKLYLVMDFAPGGELFYHLSKERRFTEARARFYIAEVLLALEYLHKRGIIYRDLKPENILLEDSGHVRLADFGLAKQGLFAPSDRTGTLCGTPAYLPPEVIRQQPYGRDMDWWCLGNLTFELITGLPPFYVQNSREIQDVYERIIRNDLRFPPYVSQTAQSLISGLLAPEPSDRLGYLDNCQTIKAHLFFHGLDWNKMLKKELEPPFVPPVRNSTDLENFDASFTHSSLADTHKAERISDAQNLRFSDFDYVEDEEDRRRSLSDSPAAAASAAPQAKK